MTANRAQLERIRLTAEEEHSLSEKWRSSKNVAALDRLVCAHIGLVVHVVKQFGKRGPQWDDLIQVGNLGLVIAARRFDPNRGTRLSTYAIYWIRSLILQHIIDGHGAVRFGTTRADRRIFFGLARARHRLEENGNKASDAELASALSVAESDVARMGPRLVGRDPSLDDPNREHLSLSTPAPDPEQLLSFAEESHTRGRRLMDALDCLDQRERIIVRKRHLSESPLTLARLGTQLHVSRERVRQLEHRALGKLRRVLMRA